MGCAGRSKNANAERRVSSQIIRKALGQIKFKHFAPMTGLEPATPGLEVRCAVHCATWAEKRETCRQSAFLAVPGYFRIYTSCRLFLQRPPCWYKARAAQSGEVCLLELHIRGILIASPKCLAFLYLFVYCRVQIWAVSTF